MKVDRTCNRDWKRERIRQRGREWLMYENLTIHEQARCLSDTVWLNGEEYLDWTKVSALIAKKFHLPRAKCNAVFGAET
ncbi:MAG TPA: hypothetical protein VGD54_07540 [Steroidobacteraceae bacterium]